MPIIKSQTLLNLHYSLLAFRFYELIDYNIKTF